MFLAVPQKGGGTEPVNRLQAGRQQQKGLRPLFCVCPMRAYGKLQSKEVVSKLRKMDNGQQGGFIFLKSQLQNLRN
jgi:hypothetical protein